MYSRKVNWTPNDLRSLSSITIRLEQWPIIIPDIKKKERKKEKIKEKEIQTKVAYKPQIIDDCEG